MSTLTESRLICPICNKNFKSQASYEKHSKALTCSLCELKFDCFKLKKDHMNLHKVKKKKENSYICSECGKLFKTITELNQHNKSKCGTIPQFSCKICDKKLMTAGSLHNHMLQHSESRFMCRFCAKFFVTRGQLKVHERIHTKEKAFICDICGKGFAHRQSLITHNTLHTGIKPYQCENCGHSFSCIGNLIKHRRNHANTCGLVPITSHRVNNPSTRIKVKINTPVAKKDTQDPPTEDERALSIDTGTTLSVGSYETLFERKRGLDMDIEHSEGNESSDSEDCCVITSPKEKKKKNKDQDKALLDFVRSRNLEGKTKGTCLYCNKVYSQFRWLFKHEQEHLVNDLIDSKEKKLKYKCSCCKKFFVTKEECREHQENSHADRLTCQDCEKVFANLDSIRAHQQNFHKGLQKKEYVYVCEKCGKKFKQKALLNLHNDRNCSNHPFECGVCKKQFTSGHSLKAHMRVHGSEKKLLCKFCGKSFHWKGQLKVHERSHTGEKPYTCLFCPRAFAYRDSLLTHSTTHTGIKPHFCKGCGWRFSCIGNLVKHKATHADTCGAWYGKGEIARGNAQEVM